MGIVINETTIPTSETIEFDATSLNKVYFDDTLVWQKKKTITSFSLSKVSENAPSGNSGAGSTATVSGKTVTIAFTKASYKKHTVVAAYGPIDLTGYETVTVSISCSTQDIADDYSGIGLGTTKGRTDLGLTTWTGSKSGTYSFSTKGNTTGYLYVRLYGECNRGYKGDFTCTYTVNSITLS